MIKEKCVESIIASMKLSHLKELSELFHIQIKENKKQNYIRYVSRYLQNNIKEVLERFIIYDEWNLIRKIYEADYAIRIDNDQISMKTKKSLKSLEYLGIIYSYDDNNVENVSMPIEIRKYIKQKIYDINIILCARNRQNIIYLFKKLLDIYGIVPMNLAEYYINRDLSEEYEVCELIKMLWDYNARCELCYIDDECNYYNLKIMDKKCIKEKIDDKFNLQHKYFSKSELNNYTEELSLNSIEKQIYIILNRHYKDSITTLEWLKDIKLMIENDISSKDISVFIKEKTTRLSEMGRKMIEQLIDNLMEKYPLWILKGYSIEELQNDTYSKFKNHIDKTFI